MFRPIVLGVENWGSWPLEEATELPSDVFAALGLIPLSRSTEYLLDFRGDFFTESSSWL